MSDLKFIFSVFNYSGYCLWGFSVLNFFEQLLNQTFNFQNINSFLSCVSFLVGVIFAIAKLSTYLRDSKTKSKILEQELIEKTNKNRVNSKHADFYENFSDQFLEPYNEKKN